MTILRYSIYLILTISLFPLDSLAAQEQEWVRAKESKIVSLEESKLNTGEYGHFNIHMRGDTVMTEKSFAGICTVLPGKAVHPAHRHAEEEYLVIMEGEGLWTLDGEQSPAKKGDVLYVEPWVFHGLTNTGAEDLVFFVVKYHPKGAALPPEPKGNHGR